MRIPISARHSGHRAEWILLLAALLAAPIAGRADEDDQVPWIGLELGPGSHGGVAIRGVVEGSPGQTAKVMAGDELLSIDGKGVDKSEEVVRRVQTSRVGSHLKLLLVNGAAKRTVDVTLTARPSMDEMQRNALLNRPAPDFTPNVQSGPKLSKLSALRGQVVLIDFFATWCGPCMDALPHIEKLHERLGGKGLRVLGVSAEAPPIVAAIATKAHLKYTVISDDTEEINAHYHVFALPTLVIIDKKGSVAEISIADPSAIEKTVEKLLQAK